MKTPLTRKYVAELERNLAEAHELLRRSTTPAAGSTNHYVFAEQNGHSQHRTALEEGKDPGASAGSTEDSGERLEFQSVYNVEAPGPILTESRSALYTTTGIPHTSAPKFVRYAASSQTAKPSPTFSLEAPPASDDFDWDERNFHSSGDGMASLTNASSRAGYLGVASGAALLRLADNGAQPASTYDINDDAQGDESMRNTPIPKAIYSLSQLEPFVDAYFSLYHISYPIVHEATFRAQVSLLGFCPPLRSN